MNNPQTRMAAFDAMSMTDRELANEYGVNVVRLYRSLGAADLTIRNACETHRLNKQQEQFQFSLARKVGEKQTFRTVAKLVAEDRYYDKDEEKILIAQIEPLAAQIIEENDAHYREHPLPPVKLKNRPDPWYIRWMRPNGP